ncbi:MAG TPA: hypothetical protein VNW47_04195 [Terriglobales bacterium]|nr:hypothetical protein [Terriglobales bacterium]
MKDDPPRVFDGHVEHDETSILAALKQTGELCGFAVEHRRHLPHFFGVPESHDLEGNRKFTFAFVTNAPNTERICSKCSATSRPRFSPASVITEKFGERISTHCGSPA